MTDALTRPIRVGVVGASVTAGASDWAAHAHIPALHALPDFELTAVCTSRAETSLPSAQRFGAALGFHNVADLAACDDIDLVTVSLRVPHHRDAVLAALAGGRAVYCEWPLATNAAQAAELTAAAAAAGVPAFVGLQLRSDPVVALAAEAVADGTLGAILSAYYEQSAPLQVECKPSRAWMAQRSAGAHTLSIHGGHALDLLATVVGDLSDATARLATRVPVWRTASGTAVTVDAPDTCFIAGSATGGAEVGVAIRAVPGGSSSWSLTVHGTRGMLRLAADGPPTVGPNTVALARNGGALQLVEPRPELEFAPPELPSGPARNVARAYGRIGAWWGAALPSSRPALPDFAAGLAMHRVLEAIEHSATHGVSVSVPAYTALDRA